MPDGPCGGGNAARSGFPGPVVENSNSSGEPWFHGPIEALYATSWVPRHSA